MKDAAAGEGFYDVRSALSPDVMERWLSESVESPVAPIVKRLRRGIVPLQPELATAARFVAFQMVRGPAFRRLMAELSAHLGPLLYMQDRMQEKRSQNSDFDPSAEELRVLYADCARNTPALYLTSTTESAMRNMTREADRLSSELASMRWSTLQSPTRVLLTSDVPATARLLTGEPLTGPQLLPASAEVVMPLTPYRLLVVSPYMQLGRAQAMLTATFAREVNEISVRAADEVVFRHPSMSWPQDLILPAAKPSLHRPSVNIGKANPNEPRTSPQEWPTLTDPTIAEIVNRLDN